MKIPKNNFDFKAGNISSYAGGAFTIEAFLDQTEFNKAIKQKFNMPVDSSKRGPKFTYTKRDNYKSLITGFMKGFQNPTEIARNRKDSVVIDITGKEDSSQSTLSRAITNATKEDNDKLKEFNQEMLQAYFKNLIQKNNGKKLKQIEISDDSTKIVTYGKQKGAKFITHYNVVGYHPDLITEDNMKLIMTGILRDGNTYSSNGSELLLQEVIDSLRPFTEKIIFRADSAYAKPEMFNELHAEDIEIEYFIKATTYMSWIEKADIKIEFQGKIYHPLGLPKAYFEETDEEGKKKLIPRYFEFYHQCDTWKRPERIATKLIYKEDKEQAILMEEANKKTIMLITNSNCPEEEAFTEYGKRGKQEQIIEEFKNESAGKNLSSSEKIQNECMFFLKIIAHNLMQMLRLETLYDTKFANARTNTVRRVLVNIGGKIVRHAGKMVLKLSSAFPLKKWFYLVMQRVSLIKLRFY